jgi:hypothetical protein
MSGYWHCECGLVNENSVGVCRKCKQPHAGYAAGPPLFENSAPVNVAQPPVFLTIAEAADLLRWDVKTMHNKISKGIFKQGTHYYKKRHEIGIRFDRAALIAWVREDVEKPEQKGQLVPMARGYFLGGG